MLQLFIEGKPVDINEQFSTLLTAAIDDIKNFSSRETTFSKTIILPATKRNNIIFGNIFNALTRSDYDPALSNYGINFNAAVSARCLVLNDNIQQLKGTLRLMQVNIQHGVPVDYEVAIFGELGGFASALGNKKLEELDFSAYDHGYTISNIVNSWDHAGDGSGYVYPLIDYGNYSTLKKHWRYPTLRPALFVKEYIEKIVAGAGYTIDFTLSATDRFKHLIIPNSQKLLSKSTTNALEVTGGANTIVIDDAPSYPNTFSSTQTLGSFTESAGVYTRILTNYYGGIYFEMNGAYTKSVTTAFQVQIRLNGTSIYSESFGLGSLSGSFSFAKQLNNIVINVGDTLDVSYRLPIVPTRTFSIDVASSYMHLVSNSPALVPININDTDPIPINDTIPKNILQKDFFSSIVRMFNLYVTEETHTDKKLVIKPYIDFYDGTIEDWSGKVDRGSAMSIKPMSELNARYYHFKFKGDSDYYNDLYKKRYNEGYGDRIYDSSYEFANETQSIDVVFSGTPLISYPTDLKRYSTIFKRTGNEPSVTEENIDSNIRILQCKRITLASSWNILDYDGTTILSTNFAYLYAGHLDDPDTPANDINFGAPKELFCEINAGDLNVNQFNVYWSPYMAEITDKDSKLMTCTIRLTGMDFYNLSFSKLKWIDGSLWRLNKIIDYNASREDTCKAEFIKLIEKTY